MQPQLLLQDDLQVQEELGHLRHFGEQLQQQIRQYDHDLQMAARLQRDFLPGTPPQIGPVRFVTLYLPAKIVSGDMYDVFRLDENRLGFYIADAVGHGVAAALLSMFIKRAMVTKRINGRSYQIVDPGETLSLLNDELANHDLPHCQFASLCYAVVNVRTGEFRLARGGHPAPVVIRANGQIENLDPEGSLLGVMAAQSYGTAETRLCEGDRVLMFSDGLEDAFYQEAGGCTCQGEIRRRAHVPTCQLVEELHRCITELHVQDRGVRDDVTIVAMQFGQMAS